MPRVSLIFALTALACLLLHFGSVRSMSDSYGQNPQHEFGAVWGQVLSPLIPFWNLEGDAFANQDFVRLVPDRQSKRGGMWNTEQNRFASWEVTFSIHIHGVSVVGADGLAFWYTQETSKLDGGFFGFTDQFTGLGIVIDTYDNDNTGLHPLLVAIKNDGTKKYTHSHEGEGDSTNMEIGHCQLNIRNLAGTSIIKVIYRNKQLIVETQLYGTNQFSHCLTANNIDLPPRYHFGFTAATGQLADNHDVYGFSVRNLDPNGPAIDSQRVFSTYDKYQIAEFLSKIYFEVKDKPSDAGAASSKQDLNQMLTLVRAVEKLDHDIKTMSTAISSLDRKITPGGLKDGADTSSIATELSALKQSVNNLSTKVALINIPAPPVAPSHQPSFAQHTAGQGIPFNPATAAASSGSTFLSVLFYGFLVVVLLGLSYLGFLYYRVKSEKEKKFF